MAAGQARTVPGAPDLQPAHHNGAEWTAPQSPRTPATGVRHSVRSTDSHRRADIARRPTSVPPESAADLRAGRPQPGSPGMPGLAPAASSGGQRSDHVRARHQRGGTRPYRVHRHCYTQSYPLAHCRPRWRLRIPASERTDPSQPACLASSTRTRTTTGTHSRHRVGRHADSRRQGRVGDSGSFSLRNGRLEVEQDWMPAPRIELADWSSRQTPPPTADEDRAGTRDQFEAPKTQRRAHCRPRHPGGSGRAAGPETTAG
jgi:hypothetical protein